MESAWFALLVVIAAVGIFVVKYILCEQHTTVGYLWECMQYPPKMQTFDALPKNYPKTALKSAKKKNRWPLGMFY